jgi:hypothetical protein
VQFSLGFQGDCVKHPEFLNGYADDCVVSWSSDWQHPNYECNLLGFSQLDDEDFFQRLMQK